MVMGSCLLERFLKNGNAFRQGRDAGWKAGWLFDGEMIDFIRCGIQSKDMSYHMLLIPVCCACLLGGCCSSEQFAQRMNGYVSSSKVTLIQELGEPIRSERIGSAELLTFLRDRTYFVEGTGPSSHTYKKKTKDGYRIDTYVSPGTAPHYVDRRCEVTFRLQNGRVVSWSSRGNDCCD